MRSKIGITKNITKVTLNKGNKIFFDSKICPIYFKITYPHFRPKSKISLQGSNFSSAFFKYVAFVMKYDSKRCLVIWSLFFVLIRKCNKNFSSINQKTFCNRTLFKKSFNFRDCVPKRRRAFSLVCLFWLNQFLCFTIFPELFI